MSDLPLLASGRDADVYGVPPGRGRRSTVLLEVADHSGGGVVSPPSTVHDCPDHEDNLILDLAAEVGALLIVSEDADLTSMSPWRGTPILRPVEFASKVDGMRRHRRR